MELGPTPEEVKLAKDIEDAFAHEAWRLGFKFAMDNDELVRILEASVLFVRSEIGRAHV